MSDPATDDEIARARSIYTSPSCAVVEIDAGAEASRIDNGVWVAAWVWLENYDEEAAE